MIVKSKNDIEINSRDKSFGLVAGKRYIVFLVEIGPNAEYCLLVERNTDYYPAYFDVGLFEVVDASLPDDWTLGQWSWSPEEANRHVDSLIVLGPKPYIDDKYYYSDLVDADGDDPIQLEYYAIRDKYNAAYSNLLKD